MCVCENSSSNVKRNAQISLWYIPYRHRLGSPKVLTINHNKVS